MTDTKLPWRTDAAGGFPLDIHDAAGEMLARVLPEAGSDTAERIVACVNGFGALKVERDELLKVLEMAVRHVDEWMRKTRRSDDSLLPWAAPARAAIAKAKGGAE